MSACGASLGPASATAVEAPRRPEHAARGAAPETRDDRAGDDRRRGRAGQHTGFDRSIQPPPPGTAPRCGYFSASLYLGYRVTPIASGCVKGWSNNSITSQSRVKYKCFWYQMFLVLRLSHRCCARASNAGRILHTLVKQYSAPANGRSDGG